MKVFTCRASIPWSAQSLDPSEDPDFSGALCSFVPHQTQSCRRPHISEHFLTCLSFFAVNFKYFEISQEGFLLQ